MSRHGGPSAVASATIAIEAPVTPVPVTPRFTG
jgi:hypothetical protein